MNVHIGIDDADSPRGGCTTHLATLLAYHISKHFFEASLLEPLNLVRLNPSIPWKTRGNGAVAIRLSVRNEDIPALISFLLRFIDKYSSKFLGPGQDPGVVIAVGEVSRRLALFYRRAVSDVVSRTYVEELERRGHIKVLKWGRGAIGATAAIGWIAERRDFTYELLVYRTYRRYGRERCVDPESVLIFDNLAKHSFNNVHDGRILITPHGPDPVLYGVRGDDPQELLAALNIIKTCEEIAGYALFITNQGTDDHVLQELSKSRFKPYRCGWVQGVLIERPHVIKGGHCVMKLLCCDGVINAVAFSETEFVSELLSLEIGSNLILQGCIKPFGNELYLHVEKALVLPSSPLTPLRPRICPRCGSRIKYLGAGRGYRCQKCGLRIHLEPRTETEIPRRCRYLAPPPHRQKHLVKPLVRSFKVMPRKVVDAVIEYYEPLDFL